MWTAKFKAGGFSVSFFWPSVSSQLCYDKLKEKRKKGRKRRRKIKAKSNAQCEQFGAKITAVVRSNPTTPTDAHHGPESQAKNSSQTTPTHKSTSKTVTWLISSLAQISDTIRETQFMAYPTPLVIKKAGLQWLEGRRRDLSPCIFYVVEHLLTLKLTCRPLMSLVVKVIVIAQILVLSSLIMQLLNFL